MRMKTTGDKETPAISGFCRMLRPVGRIFDDEGWNVWGSWPIDGPDGNVHVFLNRWPGKHRDVYVSSEIVHARAARPEGPYRILGTALAARKGDYWDSGAVLDPCGVKTENGYAMIYIGTHSRDELIDSPAMRKKISAAESNPEHPEVPVRNMRIGLATAESLDGPWKRVSDTPLIDISPNKDDWDGYFVTSPFLFAHPDGRFWLYYKGRNPRTDNRRKYGLAIADSIEGPYRKHPENPIIDFEESPKGVEDAFVYVEDGTFHMLLHAMGAITCVCGRPAVGLHLESRDGIHWENPSLAYKHNFEYFKDEKYERLEEPMCLMRKGRPAYLYLASSGGKRGASSTVLMRLAGHEDQAIRPS
jgi:hypothetical protein